MLKYTGAVKLAMCSSAPSLVLNARRVMPVESGSGGLLYARQWPVPGAARTISKSHGADHQRQQ